MNSTLTASQAATPFQNEPLLNFASDDVSKSMRRALQEVEGRLGKDFSLVIDGKRISTNSKFTSVNPARPSQVVGIHSAADGELVNQAISGALQAFATWQTVPVDKRSDLLFRAAAMMRARKFEFSAWLVYEVGKNWAEADADTAEAIDFLEFYGREAVRAFESPSLLQYPGERDELVYVPLGVGIVIPPWNFPLAITAGMTAASIVAGNTVVLKPSPFAPTIAALFLELLENCDMPEGVVNLCQGGPAVGEALVEHPMTRFIAFTGSKAVGLKINERAARAQPGQIWIKRTILEMGGKDAIVVEADADIDRAIDGVVASAFGYNGQKCSACSRLILSEKIYDNFVAALVKKVQKLECGDPRENRALGPVISNAAYDKILRYMEIAQTEGKVVCGGNALTPPQAGYYLAPTVVTEVSPATRIAQEEIFGPVLSVIRSRGFEDALAIANNSEYGLTGAVYTSDDSKIDRARRNFDVGNLYFNRKCTGAMVGVHPFGGFNMSGTDSKAGGPDYVKLFVQSKSIAYRLS